MMSDTCGPTSGMPFTRYDPDTRSWRTCQDTSLWDLPMSSPTLPKSGSMRNGELTERPTLEPHTVENEYSSLPTPTARDYKDTMVEVAKHRPEDTDTLNRAMAHLLPTPTVMDMGSNYTPQEWEAWKQEQRAAHNNGNGHGASLTQEALTLLPTPLASMGNLQRDDFTPNLRTVVENNALLPTPITQMENRKTPEFGVSLLHTLIGESTSPLLDGGSDSLDQPQIPHINEQDDNDSTQPSWSG